MIVHIITSLNRGGAEQALFRLLSQEADPTLVRVVSLTDGGIFQTRLERLGVAVTCLHMRAGLPSPIKWWHLVRLLKTWQPRLVQTWMYHADLLGGTAAALVGIPVCWGIRNSGLQLHSIKRSTRLVAWLCAKLSRLIPTRAITCSARAADIHRALGYAVPFDVVPNGLDVSAWMPLPELRASVRSELGLATDDFVFAHAGRNDPQKDHSCLALAFSRVHAAKPHARLLLCGQGLTIGDAYFDGLPFTPSARSAVTALGPRDDLPRLWQAADAFVLSSMGEGFPNAVAEAMAAGLPCVATAVGDTAEIVGNTGLIVPPRNNEALAEALQTLVDMPEYERLHLGHEARLRVQENYTLARMAEGFRQAWNKAISGAVKACAD